MQGLPRFDDPNLLVGAEHFSDAGVYLLAPDLAIVQSVDFFPPLVDDPFIFGQIAAANAMSDVFAMGGRPRTALNIVGFPDTELPIDVLTRILAGGAERIQKAGAVVVGGHSVRDTEVKFGLAVTGTVHPEKMLSNAGARPGDRILLTKALGTGFVTTAARRGKCPDEVLGAACESMIRLNGLASEVAVEMGFRGATDVTGFGLAGHAIEMAEASLVTIRIDVSSIPLLPGVDQLVSKKNLTGANREIQKSLRDKVRTAAGLDPILLELVYDPQTSGGLLVSVPSDRVDAYVEEVTAKGLPLPSIVGTVLEREDIALQLH